jgi:hypothetical protein
LSAINHRFAADAGISIIGIFWGIGIAFLTFLLVVYIEARLMKKNFDFSNQQRYGYSLVINLISTLIGLPVVFFLLKELELDILDVIIITFLMTIVIEYFSFLLIARVWSSYKSAFFFIIKSNVLSYLSMLIFPVATLLIISLFIMMFQV